MVQRTQYLQQLIDSMGNGLVKTITGIRRCGKSVLLRDISTSKESTRLCQQLLYISCSFTAIGCSCALNVWCLFKSIVGIYDLIVA